MSARPLRKVLHPASHPADNRRLRAGLASAEGLVGALLAKAVDARGVVAQPQPPYRPRRATPVVARDVVTFRAKKRVLVSMELWPGAGAREGQPFQVEEALLVDAKGARLPVVRLKQARSGQVANVFGFALEVMAGKQEAEGSCLLRLRGQGEAHFFTVAEVTFPQLP